MSSLSFSLLSIGTGEKEEKEEEKEKENMEKAHFLLKIENKGIECLQNVPLKTHIYNQQDSKVR